MLVLVPLMVTLPDVQPSRRCTRMSNRRCARVQATGVLRVVDDRGVVLARRAVGIGGLHQPVIALDEGVDLGLVYQGVVGGDAGLPALRSFPKTMSATVWSCTCPLATMAGDLPPSSSVTGTRFAGRLHDGSSDGGASGEDEMIERQGGERGTIAVDDS
jgi:hypothetical protein